MITFLITGGTIDGIDYASEADAPVHPKSLIPDFLKKLALSEPYNVEVLMLKDSRFISEEDRKLIADRCTAEHGEQVIVTHGSFTMVASATEVAKRKLAKTIIFVGSNVSADTVGSDAMANVKVAIQKVDQLPHGVYIVMQGRVFNWDNAKKNLSTGMFEEL